MFSAVGGEELFGSDGATGSNTFEAAVTPSLNTDTSKKGKTGSALESDINKAFDAQSRDLDQLLTETEGAIQEAQELMQTCVTDDD